MFLSWRSWKMAWKVLNWGGDVGLSGEREWNGKPGAVSEKVPVWRVVWTSEEKWNHHRVRHAIFSPTMLYFPVFFSLWKLISLQTWACMCVFACDNCLFGSPFGALAIAAVSRYIISVNTHVYSVKWFVESVTCILTNNTCACLAGFLIEIFSWAGLALLSLWDLAWSQPKVVWLHAKNTKQLDLASTTALYKNMYLFFLLLLTI